MSSVNQQETNGFEQESLSAEQASTFDAFKSKCAENGLLDRPAHLSKDDVCDGINDDMTLL